MTAEEYDVWILHHRTLFQMKSADDLPMFAAWFPSLAEFNLNEAKAASMAIAGDLATAGKYRTEHLSLLRHKIKMDRGARTKAQFADLDRQQDAFRCQECRGDGHLSVPHVGAIVDGIWTYPFYTMVVFCHCNRGAAKFNAISSVDMFQELPHGKHRIRPIDLREYEALHPDWRDMLTARLVQRESSFRAEQWAKRADSSAPIDAAKVKEMLERIGRTGKS